jgi:hypothetical protein
VETHAATPTTQAMCGTPNPVAVSYRPSTVTCPVCQEMQRLEQILQMLKAIL